MDLKNATTWNRLTSTISDVLGVDQNEITPESKAKDISGWDSLAHLIIVTQVEREFGVSLPYEKISNAQTVGELKDIILESQKIDPAAEPGT